MATRKRKKKNPAELVIFANPKKTRAKKNPMDAVAEEKQAVKLFKQFHGKDPKKILTVQRSAAMRLAYTSLGPLVGLAPFVEGLRIPSPDHWDDGGYPVLQFSGDLKLAANGEGTQLYAIGADQDLSGVLKQFADAGIDTSKDIVDLGPVAYVVYEARKPPSYEMTQFMHEFAEPRPSLGYDQVKREIFLAGGRYVIKGIWIEN